MLYENVVLDEAASSRVSASLGNDEQDRAAMSDLDDLDKVLDKEMVNINIFKIR